MCWAEKKCRFLLLLPLGVCALPLLDFLSPSSRKSPNSPCPCCTRQKPAKRRPPPDTAPGVCSSCSCRRRRPASAAPRGTARPPSPAPRAGPGWWRRTRRRGGGRTCPPRAPTRGPRLLGFPSEREEREQKEEEERFRRGSSCRRRCCCCLLPCRSSLRLGSPATTKTKTRRMPWALRPARGAPRRGRRSGSKEREKKAGKAAGSVDADDDVVVSVAADAADWASPPRQERRRCHCRQLLARISSIADSCRRDSSRHALSLSGECVGEGREKSTNNENKEKSAMAPKQKKGPPFRP